MVFVFLFLIELESTMDNEANTKIQSMNDNRKNHPKGLCPEEREEWNILCERLLHLYEKMPMGNTNRKVIAGYCDKNPENMLILFKGCPEDLFEVRKFLK